MRRSVEDRLVGRRCGHQTVVPRFRKRGVYGPEQRAGGRKKDGDDATGACDRCTSHAAGSHKARQLASAALPVVNILHNLFDLVPLVARNLLLCVI
eukprot:274477-Pleurochrysis_carterae.AAC.3